MQAQLSNCAKPQTKSIHLMFTHFHAFKYPTLRLEPQTQLHKEPIEQELARALHSHISSRT